MILTTTKEKTHNNITKLILGFVLMPLFAIAMVCCIPVVIALFFVYWIMEK